MQFGHRKEYRPDLPQVTGRPAVLAPLGMPLATDVVAGNRAADPLYGPCMERVQARVGRRGLLSGGDCQMAARQTRAWVANQEADSLCPLPQGPLAEGEVATAVTALEQGEVALRPGYRESPDGEAERITAGYERPVAMSCEANGDSQSWTERRLVVRSLRHAPAAAASLRTRVAKAQAQVEAVHQRGRGRQRFAEIDELRHAATAIVQR